MQSDYTTTGQQRQAVFKHLAAGKPLSTLYAREHLGICHPAGRVQELRGQGFNIVTNWRNQKDATGKLHRVAEYVLFSSRSRRRQRDVRVVA